MSGLDIFLRVLGGVVTGAIVYAVMAFTPFLEVSQNAAVGVVAVVFLLVAIFGFDMFKFVMKLLHDFW